MESPLGHVHPGGLELVIVAVVELDVSLFGHDRIPDRDLGHGQPSRNCEYWSLEAQARC